MAKSKPATSDDDILTEARQRFQLAVDAEAETRRKALEDVRFASGDQWPAGLLAKREAEGRPALTINSLPNIIRQVVNEVRSNRPSIQVNPVGDTDDVDDAGIVQGLCRHVEISSNADEAYDTAVDCAARGGFGFIRVRTVQEADSFDQDIRIERVRNPFSVYLDPSAQNSDGSDAKWGFVVEDMPVEVYKLEYPDSEVASLGYQAIGNRVPGWITKDSIRVVEYFRIVNTPATLVKLATGQSEFEDELPDNFPSELIVAKRESFRCKTEWCKLNGIEILEKTEWPSPFVPLIPVYGDEVDIEGMVDHVGMVRYAKDPVMQYNVHASAQTEAVALAPKTPYVGAEGQFEGHEDQWETANVVNHAFLQYKPTSLSGQLMPPPQRQNFEPAIMAITQTMMRASQDVKATTGFFEAGLGMQGPEQSGKAIIARQKESDMGSSHFSLNLARAMKHVGRILVSLFPKIYDSARILKIIDPDGSRRSVVVHAGDPMNAQLLAEQHSIQDVLSIDLGKYDVTVSVGPSYQSKRDEALQSMLALINTYPAIAPVIGDLLVRNTDWPGHEEIADRLHKMLPSQLADQPEGQPPLPPQVQQIVQQHQGLIEANNKLHEILNNRVIEKQAESAMQQQELALKLEIAKIEASTKLAATEATINSKEALAEIQRELVLLRTRAQFAHEVGLQSMSQAHKAKEAHHAEQTVIVAAPVTPEPPEPGYQQQ